MRASALLSLSSTTGAGAPQSAARFGASERQALARRGILSGALAALMLATLALTGPQPARAANPTPGQAPPAGSWRLEDIAGGGVLDRIQVVLNIDADGRVSGSGGCNRMSARALVAGQNISFSLVATTRMACPPAVMAQEQRFTAALASVRSWRADPATRKLYLTAADGAPLLQFSAM